MLTVTHVELTRDLRIARIYLSLLNPRDTSEEVLRELLRRRKEIRYHLGSELRIKYVPQLRFYVDESLERSARIQSILKNLRSDEMSNER